MGIGGKVEVGPTTADIAGDGSLGDGKGGRSMMKGGGSAGIEGIAKRVVARCRLVVVRMRSARGEHLRPLEARRRPVVLAGRPCEIARIREIVARRPILVRRRRDVLQLTHTLKRDRGIQEDVFGRDGLSREQPSLIG